MALNFKLEIITPEKTIFSSEVEQVTIPSYEGEMTILKDHISLVTFLRPGIIKIGEKDLENFYGNRGRRGNFLPKGFRKVDKVEVVTPENL